MLAATLIEHAGSDEQRARWLPGLASGEITGAAGDAPELVHGGAGAAVIVIADSGNWDIGEPALTGPLGELDTRTGGELRSLAPFGELKGTRFKSVLAASGEVTAGRVMAISAGDPATIDRETVAVPGAQGQAAYTMETTFPLRTRFATLDVRQYGFEKRISYEQTTGTPILRPNPYEVIAFVNSARTNAVSAATFKNPSSAQRTAAT